MNDIDQVPRFTVEPRDAVVPEIATTHAPAPVKKPVRAKPASETDNAENPGSPARQD